MTGQGLPMNKLTTVEGNARQLLSAGELEELRRISSPTIANAIEVFNVRARGAGVTNARIQCIFPELGALVGYACTARIHSTQPPRIPRDVSRTEYWEYVQSFPGARVSVVEDLSETPGGAYWGEVNASIHLALGCCGVITNGTVRDLDEVRRLGFHFFAGGVQVSHGYAHLHDFNRPASVFGILVHPGELIHADRHGAVVIPGEIARDVVRAARELELREKSMLVACKLPNVIEELDGLIPHEY